MKFVRSAAHQFLRRRQRDFLLSHLPKQSICAEVGVFTGHFSARILRLTEPARLHLIDPWKSIYVEDYREPLSQADLDRMHASVLSRFKNQMAQGRVVVHRATSLDAGGTFEDESLDWVYIDADHTYEAVKNDLELYYCKVKPAGYIGGDDYGQKGWWDGGVTRAVEEFRADGRCATVLLQGYQFLLRKL